MSGGEEFSSESILERRIQRTYRLGIALVCFGATLNWLGFAQDHVYLDLMRYFGIAAVISGSFCVSVSMCRWMGRSVISRRVSQEERNTNCTTTNVHVINLSLPLFVPCENSEILTNKPPEYDIAVGDLPSYNDAIKFSNCSNLEEEEQFLVASSLEKINKSSSSQGLSTAPPPYSSDMDITRKDEFSKDKHVV